MSFRPMKAPIAVPDIYKLEYPLLGSPKIDGIRGATIDGQVLSQTLKRHPNKQVQRVFGAVDGLDGELVYGPPVGPDVMNRAQSAVRSVDKTGDFRFYLFDWILEPYMPYFLRQEELRDAVRGHPQYQILEQRMLKSPAEVLEYEAEQLQAGFEGLMLRTFEGHYKHNRATHRDKLIWKLKRFDDVELTCVDVEAAKANNNTKVVNALGLTERTYSKFSKEDKEEVGVYICLDGANIVRVAPGMMTKEQRELHFHTRSIIGQRLTVRHFGRTPSGEMRFARVISIREDL